MSEVLLAKVVLTNGIRTSAVQAIRVAKLFIAFFLNWGGASMQILV
jgi:hypothetical protein